MFKPIVFGKPIAALCALAGLFVALTLVLIGAFLEWSSRDIFFVENELRARPVASLVWRANAPDPRSRGDGRDRRLPGAKASATAGG